MLRTQLQFSRILIGLLLLENGATAPRSDLSLELKLWKGATSPPALFPYPGLAESGLFYLFCFPSLTIYISVRTTSWHVHSINVYKKRYSNTCCEYESLKVYTNQI